MAKFSKVVGTIVEITNRGKCNFGHRVGEKFVFTEKGVDRPLCFYAQQALEPAIEVLLHAGWFPWARKKKGGRKMIYWGCSHPGNRYPGLGQVIFKLEAEE